MAPHPPSHRADPLPLAGRAPGTRRPAAGVRRLLLAAALAGSALALAAAPAAPPLPPIAPGDAYFSPLFRTLGRQGAARSSFTESRWFSFRSEPVVLQGELRFSPELGLSLHYTAPEERTVIFDADGLLLRDARGRSQAVPADPHFADVGQMLLAIFRFDEAGIQRAFEVEGAHSGPSWRVVFTPRSAEVRHRIGTIDVRGEANRVARLEFRRSSSQRIEIDVTASTVPATFSAEERRRFFR